VLAFDAFVGNIDARVMNFDSITVSGLSSTAFTREFNAAGIDSVNFDLTSGRDSEVIFANAVTGWSDDAVFALRLSSSDLSDGSSDLITSLQSSLGALSGNTYKIYIDDEEEAYYTGAIGDGGCVWKDGDVSKLLSLAVDNSQSLVFAVAVVLPTEPVSGKSGMLA